METGEHAIGSMELEKVEKEFLLDLFATAEKELLGEIGRTDARAYRAKLEKRLALLERVRSKVEGSIPAGEKMMPRFTIGARVRIAGKTTDRTGTVREVLESAKREGEFDRYRVELSDGTIETFSDLELSPAGAGPTIPAEDVA
jgi:hypothetical protein